MKIKKLPSKFQMARNLAVDMLKNLSEVAKGNKLLLDKDEAKKRWEICKPCPFLVNTQCLECGCFMNIKVNFAASKCPIKKW